jgi:hypothetical protein
MLRKKQKRQGEKHERFLGKNKSLKAQAESELRKHEGTSKKHGIKSYYIAVNV